MKSLYNLKSIFASSLLMATAGLLSSCNVHEYPESAGGGGKETLILNLQFDTDFEIFDYDYTRSQDSRFSEYAPAEGQMQYIVHAYPLQNGEIDRTKYETFTYTRDISGSYDCETAIQLNPGQYRIYVWSDFLVAGKSYYNTDNFGLVTVETDPYIGDTDYRDAFVGTADVSVLTRTSALAEEDGMRAEIDFQTINVSMGRPLAKFEFISTDLEKLLEAEAANNPGKEVNLEDYYAVISYPMYLPISYNCFSERPNDSSMGIRFTTTLTQFSESEVSLGFDYVFVNHAESHINAQVAVYRKSDNMQVGISPQISIPLYRNHDTLVRGSFLYIQESQGVGIDPGFNGDFKFNFYL